MGNLLQTRWDTQILAAKPASDARQERFVVTGSFLRRFVTFVAKLSWAFLAAREDSTGWQGKGSPIEKEFIVGLALREERG